MHESIRGRAPNVRLQIGVWHSEAKAEQFVVLWPPFSSPYLRSFAQSDLDAGGGKHLGPLALLRNLAGHVTIRTKRGFEIDP